MSCTTACRAGQHLADLDALIQALIFIGEHVEEQDLTRLRPVAIGLLYLASDCCRNTDRRLASCPFTLH